ncbi:MAG: proline--tRNA ligase, partial [Candidatus Woesearchaeota archaeon]
MAENKSTLGINVKKDDDVNQWYSDLIQKSGLIEYSDVSGCYILRPKSQFIWDTIRDFMDSRIKRKGVKNVSFPLFIPESLLTKEKEHVEGFSPEVAWVTHGGNTELPERLAIRPTSETIMYPAYSKWIRSYNDLPLKLNQWGNVVRWEFKHPLPFLRSREFYWQEGHTAFATKEEADAEAKDILLDLYKRTYEELLAIPCLTGYKSEKEKFAGADYSISCEIYLPIRKAIQGCTSHHLGQNFSKAFNITYLDKDGSEKHVYQNSWGFTTRSIGIMIMTHSDSRGLVLPPKVAENQVAVIPITRKSNMDTINKRCDELSRELKRYNPFVDKRDKSMGFKLNDAELNGYPIRVEIGEKELENDAAVLVRRDTLEKQTVPFGSLKDIIKVVLEEIQSNLFRKAQKNLQDNITESYQLKEIKRLVADGKIVKTVF